MLDETRDSKEAETQRNGLSFLEKLKNVQFPHPLTIIFIIVLCAAFATYVLPGGEFQRVEKEVQGRVFKVVVPGSFHFIPHKPQGIFALVLVPFEGLLSAADIIILLFIIGGAFSIIKETGALSAGIYRITQLLKGREVIIIPVLMILFAAAGGSFGMYEEVLPFVGLVVPMALAMGYDSIVGVSMVYLGTVLGFCGAFFNPFTVGVAQGIAGLPITSGWEYRLVVWAVMVSAGVIYTLRYAGKIKKNPQLSEAYESDQKFRERYLSVEEKEEYRLTLPHIVILTLLLGAFLALAICVKKYSWGFRELTGLFFALGLVSGGIGIKSFNRVIEAFIEGARDMMTAVLLIGITRGVKIMLDNGLVMDTMLYYLSSGISHFPKLIAVWIMFFVQCIMNLFIQSGSAQAAVSMPIMAPLSDIIGVSRQTAVLAYQLGDGFTNFAIPWNGITLAVLNIGFVPIWAWFKWAWKLQAWLVLVCMLLLVWPTYANWGP